jgi:hypothetical protein
VRQHAGDSAKGGGEVALIAKSGDETTAMSEISRSGQDKSDCARAMRMRRMYSLME